MGLPFRHALEAKRASLRDKRTNTKELTNEAKRINSLRNREKSYHAFVFAFRRLSTRNLYAQKNADIELRRNWHQLRYLSPTFPINQF